MKRPRFRLFWLLLIVPTLATGGFAMRLLYNEQQRLEEASLQSARERADRIVENIDLAVAEVKIGLMDSLASLPEKGLADRLQQWNAANEFVNGYLICSSSGGVLTGEPSVTLDNCLFQLKKQGVIGGLQQLDHQVQSSAGQQRVDISQRSPGPPGTPPAPQTDPRLSEAQAAKMNFLASRMKRKEMKEKTKLPADVPTEAGTAWGGNGSDNPVPMTPKNDWVYSESDANLNLAGWFQQQSGSNVRAIEVAMDPLLEDLRAAFPEEASRSEVFELMDARGSIVHSTGGRVLASTKRKPEFVLAIGGELPGWTLSVHHLWQNSIGSNLFLLGSILLGFLLVSTLTGGVLLSRQAQRDTLLARQKTTFVSNVTHELKTPLTSIRMYAEMLEENRVRDDEKKSRYLQIIVSESQRLTRLVNNVLSFSRIEQGKREFHVEECDISPMLLELVENQRLAAEKAGMKLHAHGLTQPLIACVDRDALEQVFLNLTDNAIKYACAGEELSVSARGDDNAVRIEVHDAGPGIPAGHREAIFERFHRVDDALTSSATGAGLGLSIARKLARGFGGDLLYQQNKPRGSCFEIVIPRKTHGSRRR